MGNKDRARELLEKHKEGRPHVLKLLGKLCLSNQEYFKAVEYFEDARMVYQKMAEKPDSVPASASNKKTFACRLLGDALVECQKFNEALQWYAQAGSSKKAQLHKKIASEEEVAFQKDPILYLTTKFQAKKSVFQCSF
jgi:hypothetical protein